MKKKILAVILLLIVCFMPIMLSGCSQAETTQHNIAQKANNFKVYRKMTFVNLYTNDLLYSVEGYFSLQSSYENTYQGQQEIAIIIKVAENEYKMHYFSIANNVTYVIEQTQNIYSDPYHWQINWYIALPY